MGKFKTRIFKMNLSSYAMLTFAFILAGVVVMVLKEPAQRLGARLFGPRQRPAAPAPAAAAAPAPASGTDGLKSPDTWAGDNGLQFED